MERIKLAVNNFIAFLGYKITRADPPGTMSRRGWDNVQIESERHLIKGKVPDIGSGPSSWPREQFGDQCELITFDQVKTPNVDVVGNLLELSKYFEPNTFDVVICMEVLEHVAQPFVATDEMHKVLKPGGILLATAPFEHGLHGEEYGDYFRYTRQGWRELLKKFSHVELRWLGPEIMPKQYFAKAVK